MVQKKKGKKRLFKHLFLCRFLPVKLEMVSRLDPGSTISSAIDSVEAVDFVTLLLP